MDYKPWFWGLDPLFTTKVKLNICDVLALQRYEELPEVYRILNHPITAVHVLGDVVSIIDDGTGVISCCQWREKKDSDEGLFVPRLGQLVTVRGTVSEFREQRQLKVEAMFPVEDPNSEPLHWLEVAHLKRTIYSRPFTLPNGISSTCSGLTANGDIQKPTVTLKEAVLGCLENRKEPFTVSELLKDKRLVAVCSDVLSRKNGASVVSLCEAAVKEELESAVKSLQSDGAVIPAVWDDQAQETVYECFVEELHLHPVIVSFISTRLQNTRSAELGVPEEWVVEHVKSDRRLSNLPTALLRAAMQRLVSSSKIYPVGHSAYKLV